MKHYLMEYGRWISIEEKLPYYHNFVLVVGKAFRDGKDVTPWGMARYDHFLGKWIFWEKDHDDNKDVLNSRNITHWQSPLMPGQSYSARIVERDNDDGDPK